jgi:hypothetical protein
MRSQRRGERHHSVAAGARTHHCSRIREQATQFAIGTEGVEIRVWTMMKGLFRPTRNELLAPRLQILTELATLPVDSGDRGMGLTNLENIRRVLTHLAPPVLRLLAAGAQTGKDLRLTAGQDRPSAYKIYSHNS